MHDVYFYAITRDGKNISTMERDEHGEIILESGKTGRHVSAVAMLSGPVYEPGYIEITEQQYAECQGCFIVDGKFVKPEDYNV